MKITDTNVPFQNHAWWLQNFQWNNLKVSHGMDLMKHMTESGLFIFPNNELVWDHNKGKLLDLNSVHAITRLDTITVGQHSKKISNDKAGGLLRTLFF